MKKINCPLCNEKYNELNGLYSHIESEHSDNLPEGYSVQQYLYYIKTGKTHGNCVVCKHETTWNESTGKYKRFCENPKCKEKYREEFKKRMVGKYGKTTLLNDPDQQRKMLAHRHISGEYIWSDGTKKAYTGSYELDFLRMLDVFMNFDSSDVMTPSPHTYYYTYENEKKFYIPDVFIPSLNLEIEIKDGGDNPNMHGKIQAVDKVKEKLKDDVMKSQKEYDYIKIVNKNYDGFFEYLMSKKEQTANAKNIPLGDIVNESTDIYLDIDESKSRNMKACKDLVKEWSKFKYGIPKDGKISNVPSAEYYDENYRYLSPQEFKKYGGGICWDFVAYGADYLDRKYRDVEYKKYYIITDTPPNYDTHTFILIEDNGVYLYPESSFKKIEGVHKFSDPTHAFNYIVKNMYTMNSNDRFNNIKFDVFEFSDMDEYGCTAAKYMELMNEEGILIYQGNIFKKDNEFIKDIKANIKESYEPVMEVSTRLRDIDEYYDFDFFVNGDTRFLFVTGLPASSKIRTAHDISTALHAEYIDLDLFTSSVINQILDGGYMGGASREYIDIIIDYAQKYLPHNPHNPLHILQPTEKHIIDFINTLITKLNIKKKYVIQGCYIYRYFESLKYLVDRSSIVIVNDAVSKTIKQYTLARNAIVYSIINDENTDISKYKEWFFEEAQRLNEFSRAVVNYRKDNSSFRYTKKYYPVYVALIFSGSGLAHAIQKVTGDEFSHSLISFDPSLRAMYSFGPTIDGLSLELGMVHEDITQSVYKKPIKYALYVTFVTADELKAMKRTLYSIHSQGRKIKYNMEGLIKYAVGLNPETKNKLFCSEFVATVLNTGKNRTDGLRAAEVRPESFKTLSNYTLVQRGIMTEYNMDVTIDRTKALIKKCK